MKEVLLHIGTHKTGTTSIQRSLRKYSDATTIYGAFSIPNHSAAMTTIFSDDVYNFVGWTRKGLSKAQIDERRSTYTEILEQHLKDETHERLIISGEGMSVWPEKTKRAMLDFFQTRGIRVKVICFVRPPHDYMTSSMQQRIKGGAKFVKPFSPSYRDSLMLFQKLIPAQDLIVRNFRQVLEEHGDAVLGFASICGLDKDRIKLSRVNSSLSATATRLLFRLNTLPFSTFGTMDRVAARDKTVALLAEAFPVTPDDKLDGEAMSGVMTPDLDEEITFLAESFGIDFSDQRAGGVVDIGQSKAYLSDLSGVDRSRLANVLLKQNVPVAGGDSLNVMLSSLYNSFLVRPELVDGDADYLRDIALKIETGGALELQDALSLMSLAARARPGCGDTEKKLAEYAARLRDASE